MTIDGLNSNQGVLPGTESLLPPRAGCSPILKWAGSKRWLVPTLAPAIYERLAITGGRYIEPFLGGGAIALDLGLPNMLLGDACRPLIAMYQAICKSPTAVAWALRTFVDQGIDKESYVQIRRSESSSPVIAAARFIYLNKFGFNGLYRENSNGQFNVPHGGDRSNAKIPDSTAFEAVARALRNADVQVADYCETIPSAQEGDVIYADPPYFGTFSDYTAGGFTEDEHLDLAALLEAAHYRGAVIVTSNSDHERVRQLYSWASINPVQERYMIGATGDRRGERSAVLIVSDETFLQGRS